jgi:hypothetical protein
MNYLKPHKEFFAMKLSIIVAATIFLTSVLGQAADLNLVRGNVQKISLQTSGLVGTCAQVAPVVDFINSELNDIKASMNEFRASRNPHLELALSDLDSAIAAINLGLIDCQNDPNWNRSKILADMYLLNIDSQLMIAIHGVGPDLLKIK